MSFDERFLDAAVPDTYDRDRQLRLDERDLLLQVARLLAKLVLWKNIDGRSEALALLKIADRIAAATPPPAPPKEPADTKETP